MEATSIYTYTSARGIDGDMVHEDETLNIDPHGYASAFVTRREMSGKASVKTWPRTIGGVEYIEWTYTGQWSSVDDEPYHVSLCAEFMVPYEQA